MDSFNARETLEKEYGKVTDTEWDFAVYQFERNSFTERTLTTAQALDELSTTIDWRRRNL